MFSCLIIGLGSVLRGDDGVGEAVINALRKEKLSRNYKLLSKDVTGLDLLKYFEKHHLIIIIDAALMSAPPGTIKIFSNKQKSRYKLLNYSIIPIKLYKTHGISLQETLVLAKKIGLKNNVYVIGVEPECIDYKLNLSKDIQAVIPKIIYTVKSLIDEALKKYDLN